MNQLAVTSKANMLLDPQVWNLIRDQATVLMRSGFLPKGIDTPEKAIAIMIKGVELSIPPMQAFAHIYIVGGRPGISAELMLSLILRAILNLPLKYEKRDDTACIVVVTRPGGQPERFSFTIEDAKRAGLLRNDTWTKYPRAMLRSRAISEMGRSLFPDLLMGCSYTPEELGAVVSEDGMVIDVKASAPQVQEKPPEMITPVEIQFVFNLINQKKNPDTITEKYRDLLSKRFELKNTKDLTRAQYYEVVDWINSHEAAEPETEAQATAGSAE